MHSQPLALRSELNSGASDHPWGVSSAFLESTCGKLSGLDMIWKGAHLSISGPTVGCTCQAKHEVIKIKKTWALPKLKRQSIEQRLCVIMYMWILSFHFQGISTMWRKSSAVSASWMLYILFIGKYPATVAGISHIRLHVVPSSKTMFFSSLILTVFSKLWIKMKIKKWIN